MFLLDFKYFGFVVTYVTWPSDVTSEVMMIAEIKWRKDELDIGRNDILICVSDRLAFCDGCLASSSVDLFFCNTN